MHFKLTDANEVLTCTRDPNCPRGTIHLFVQTAEDKTEKKNTQYRRGTDVECFRQAAKSKCLRKSVEHVNRTLRREAQRIPPGRGGRQASGAVRVLKRSATASRCSFSFPLPLPVSLARHVRTKPNIRAISFSSFFHASSLWVSSASSSFSGCSSLPCLHYFLAGHCLCGSQGPRVCPPR